jgi:hypothetical protein
MREIEKCFKTGRRAVDTTWGLKSVFFCSVVRMVLIQPAAAARLRSNPDIKITFSFFSSAAFTTYKK